MIRLITGGSGSGKSEYAENLIVTENRRLFLDGTMQDMYYIATMDTQSISAKKRIEKHRRNREGKGFVTLESLLLSDSDMEPIKKVGEKAILLEDVSNLLANYMFSGSITAFHPDMIVNRIINISRFSNSITIVTNEIFGDAIDYADSMVEYLDALAYINSSLAQLSDSFIEVVYGYPYIIK